MNNPTDTNQASEDELDEQIRLLLQDAMGDFPTEHLLEYHTDNFKQAILDWHNKQVLEIIGEDEEQYLPLPGADNFIAVQRTVGRNQARAEARQRLEESRNELFR